MRNHDVPSMSSDPFPLVRMTCERIERPWGMSMILHEVGHKAAPRMEVFHQSP